MIGVFMFVMLVIGFVVCYYVAVIPILTENVAVKRELEFLTERDKHLVRMIDNLQDPYNEKSKLEKPTVLEVKYKSQSLGIDCDRCGRDVNVTRQKVDLAVMRLDFGKSNLKVKFKKEENGK